jgi:ABC-type nickel/cobalt efflux system permease component RcnA
MSHDLAILTVTAASIGLVHTLFGPDHYLPFVVLSRARSWSMTRTAAVTLACGFGHVASSVVLGALGIAFGLAMARLQWIESFRGNVAAWLLTIFGLGYTLWGLHRATRPRPHDHVHSHADGAVHVHHHGHSGATAHGRGDAAASRHEHPHGAADPTSLTPWVLFMIFVLDRQVREVLPRLRRRRDTRLRRRHPPGALTNQGPPTATSSNSETVPTPNSRAALPGGSNCRS